MNNQFLELSDQGKNGAGRWIGGTALILFCWLILGSFVAAPFLILSGAAFTGDTSSGDPFWNYLGLNLSFFGIWLGVWLAIRFIHQRAFRTLITPKPKMSWARVGVGFGTWLVLVALAQLIEFAIYPQRAQLTFNAAEWLRFLPLILILTPIQTSAEELLFRGYWLQGTGRLARNVIVLCIVNGLLFGLPHMFNPEVLSNPENTLLLFLNYFATGAVLAFYTLRDQRLELALGAHAANNMFAALAVNYKDSALTTPAIFTNPVLDAPFGLATLILIAAAFYLIVFRLFDRKHDKHPEG
ncbi:MAG: CPBP family intramembrane metalloprotease [Anaerolineae bacterium]|nr:CPBP family intramembrane metalloprotease [Anaerolineae bacterium]